MARDGCEAFYCSTRGHRSRFIRAIAAQCKAGLPELMLSSNPETPAEDLTPYLHNISRFQVLCVNPGLAGQKFLPLALEKVKWLKYAIPACYN